MSRISLVILVSFVALLSAACTTMKVVEPKQTRTIKTFSDDGETVLKEEVVVVEAVTEPVEEDESVGSRWNKWCWAIPGCSQETGEINGKRYTTRSQNGFNALNLVFPSGGTSVASLIRTEAAAGNTDAEAKMRAAVAEQIEEGEDMTSAILALRADPDNIAASVGRNSSSSSRVDVHRERRREDLSRFISGLSPEQRLRIVGR